MGSLLINLVSKDVLEWAVLDAKFVQVNRGTFEVIIYYNIDSTKRGLKIKIKEQNSKSGDAKGFMKQLWFTYFSFCISLS
ncbi:hypothetical protein CUMW_154870 [Citrus unshiu]|uniref:Uncharacterized protein n=1 Tax=Citrus unshiu TaxID=55188 RepID=A0A2H5PPB6_CITUN|nr:hypothetical protein CUMW_154870 [Citrus unshiu]